MSRSLMPSHLQHRPAQYLEYRHEATSQFFEKGLNPVEVATIADHKDSKNVNALYISKCREFSRETGLVTLSATPFTQYEGNYDESSDSSFGRLCPYWSSDFVTNINYQNQHED